MPFWMRRSSWHWGRRTRLCCEKPSRAAKDPTASPIINMDMSAASRALRHAYHFNSQTVINKYHYLNVSRKHAAERVGDETAFTGNPQGSPDNFTPMRAMQRAASSSVPSLGVSRVNVPNWSVSNPVTCSIMQPRSGPNIGAMTCSFPC